MRYVIAGAGAAGAAAAARLAELARYGDEIIVLEATSHPAPSKVLWPEYAAGEVSPELLASSAPQTRHACRPAAWAAGSHGQTRMDHALTGFDPRERTALLASGEPLAYDRLLVATGLPSAQVDVNGAAGPGVYHLGSLTAAAALRDRTLAMVPADPVAVVGGGAAGIRMAQSLAARGHPVTLIEMAAGLLPGIVDRPLASEVAAILGRLGVAVRTGIRAVEVQRSSDGMPTGLRCAPSAGGDDCHVPCRTVAFCTGAQAAARRDSPSLAPTELTDLGALAVDTDMRTGWPDAFAAGDIALPAGWERPPGLWAVAQWQGRQAALTMTGRAGGPPPPAVWLTVRLGERMLCAFRPYAPVDGTPDSGWRTRLVVAADLERWGVSHRTINGGVGVAG